MKYAISAIAVIDQEKMYKRYRDGSVPKWANTVYTHATRLFARLEMSGRRVVQQQEGTQVPAKPLVIEQ